jgi:hypothetical protein
MKAVGEIPDEFAKVNAPLGREEKRRFPPVKGKLHLAQFHGQGMATDGCGGIDVRRMLQGFAALF